MEREVGVSKEHINIGHCNNPDCGGSCFFCCCFVCKVCGLSEGALTTDCPGGHVSMETTDKIYATGKLDYRDPEGWVELPNPTWQCWIKYARPGDKHYVEGVSEGQTPT